MEEKNGDGEGKNKQKWMTNEKNIGKKVFFDIVVVPGKLFYLIGEAV